MVVLAAACCCDLMQIGIFLLFAVLSLSLPLSSS
jgi:hypothetical protein